MTPPFDNGRDLLFVLLILFVANFHHYGERLRDVKWFRDPIWTTAALALQFWFIVTYGVFDNQQFIYFQF